MWAGGEAGLDRVAPCVPGILGAGYAAWIRALVGSSGGGCFFCLPRPARACSRASLESVRAVGMTGQWGVAEARPLVGRSVVVASGVSGCSQGRSQARLKPVLPLGEGDVG